MVADAYSPYVYASSRRRKRDFQNARNYTIEALGVESGVMTNEYGNGGSLCVELDNGRVLFKEPGWSMYVHTVCVVPACSAITALDQRADALHPSGGVS